MSTYKPTIVDRKSGFLVLYWGDSTFYIEGVTPQYTLHLEPSKNPNEPIPPMVCPLEGDEISLMGGIFENFHEEMLSIDFTKRVTPKDAREVIQHAHDMGHPWSMRAFSNRYGVSLTFSFEDMRRVIEFKLRSS